MGSNENLILSKKELTKTIDAAKDENKKELYMTEYFIGMHFNFDDEKYDRDFTSKISGIEFCNFSKEEIQRMINIAKRDKFKIGIHFPLDKSSYKYRDPLVLSLSEDERLEGLTAIEKEIKFAKEIEAEYFLIHFPKPIVIDSNLEWDKCRLNEHEFIYDKEYSFDQFKRNCYETFDKLSVLSKQYNIQIVLEIEMLNKYLYQGELLKELLDKYTDIKLCLDSARLHVLSKIDKNFDYKNFIRKMAKYTYLLHVANIKVTDIIAQGHHPALKELRLEDGWSNIGEFLSIISSENKNLKILFEHRSDILTNDELMECYEWIMSYFR